MCSLFREKTTITLLTQEQIARRAVSDMDYVQNLVGRTRDLVIDAYVNSFHKTWWMNLGLAGVCLILALLMRERRL
jgi:hypothetical protein